MLKTQEAPRRPAPAPARWSPPRYDARTGRGPMLTNSPRYQMGIAPAIAFAWKLLLPVAGIVGAVVGGSYLLKDQLGIDTSKVPQAAALAGAGAASFFAADLLSEGIRPVAYILGVAGLAGATIVLFSKPEEPRYTIPPPSLPANVQVQPAAPGAMEQRLLVALDPNQDWNRSVFREQEFSFSAANQTRSPVAFYAGLALYDMDGKVYWRTPMIARRVVQVPALDSVGDKLSIPALGPGATGEYALEVQVFRNRDDDQYVWRSQSQGLQMAWVSLS